MAWERDKNVRVGLAQRITAAAVTQMSARKNMERREREGARWKKRGESKSTRHNSEFLKMTMLSLCAGQAVHGM